MSYSWHLFSWLLFFGVLRRWFDISPSPLLSHPWTSCQTSAAIFLSSSFTFSQLFYLSFLSSKAPLSHVCPSNRGVFRNKAGGEFRIWGRKKLLGGRSFPFPVYFPTIRKQVKFCFCLPIGLNKIVYIILFSFLVFKIRSLSIYIPFQYGCNNCIWFSFYGYFLWLKMFVYKSTNCCFFFSAISARPYLFYA